MKGNIEKPEYYANENVRCEVMRHFGHFMTESTGHFSEYLPWFRSSRRALKLHCDEPDLGGESGSSFKFGKMLAEKYKEKDYLETESTTLENRSVEYGSCILEAQETGNPFRLNGNVRNDGYIDNLPAGSCKEMPVSVDKGGLHRFEGNSLRKTPTVSIPENLQRVDVPVDPARAIAHRLADPATRKLSK